ncbi:MAG: hypothetical protein QM278_00900 [Pseudomonadota bacterium]|nr:hypothetical protein [Pseudomonadota bacterium]
MDNANYPPPTPEEDERTAVSDGAENAAAIWAPAPGGQNPEGQTCFWSATAMKLPSKSGGQNFLTVVDSTYDFRYFTYAGAPA